MALKIKVATLHDCEKEVKKLFTNILNDYCDRFKLVVKDEIKEVIICIIEYDAEASSAGLTCYADEGDKILIQVRDPFLSGWEGNQYVMDKFINVLCHEMVHACQKLTGRTGIKVKGLMYDKESEAEEYFFDPLEIEARLFEAPYTSMYGQDL